MVMSKTRLDRKRLGWFDTPQNIVNFMVSLIPKPILISAKKILEPACGYAPFSRRIAEIRGSWDGLQGIDVNQDIIKYLRKHYPRYEVIYGDYLLTDLTSDYDIIIGNPPYGIIGDESHYPISTFKDRKKLYKKIFETWKGKYNIYGLFIEKSVKLLRNGGILVFIVPATWMILDEFEKLRFFLAKSGEIHIYYVGKVFPGINVITVILYLIKGGKGLKLYDAEKLRKPVLNRIIRNYKGEIITFETKLTKLIETNAIARLGDLVDIKISPRSPEIKKCPFVKRQKISNEYLPILNGKNLQPNRIDYETCYTGYYMHRENVGRLRKWFLVDRIVVGHTKGGKLVSAIEKKHYPWMGDVYHLIPRNLNTLLHKFSLKEINEILNSKIMNKYMKDKYREITPHTTKTQLKYLPLIPLNKLKELEKLL